MTSQLVLLKYDESETLNMKSNCSLFLKAIISSQHRFNSRSEQLAIMTKQVNSLLLRTGNTLLSMLNYFHSKTSMMKTQMSISKSLVVLRDVLLMTTQVNSSFLRTENKMHTVSFLRYRGVL